MEDRHQTAPLPPQLLRGVRGDLTTHSLPPTSQSPVDTRVSLTPTPGHHCELRGTWVPVGSKTLIRCPGAGRVVVRAALEEQREITESLAPVVVADLQTEGTHGQNGCEVGVPGQRTRERGGGVGGSPDTGIFHGSPFESYSPDTEPLHKRKITKGKTSWTSGVGVSEVLPTRSGGRQSARGERRCWVGTTIDE